MLAFGDVTAVLFVAAISEYDQTCFEDRATNRMVESLNVFEETCSAPALKDAAIILFLNKYDLFTQNLSQSSFKKYFPDYKSAEDVSAVGQYISDLYKSAAARAFTKLGRPDRKLFYHFTTATSKRNVKKIWADVYDILTTASLKQINLL